MRKKVLFLCTGNSCRSQMAEGFLNNLGRERFIAFSAGSKPSSINPFAVRVMQEKGIDISNNKSEHLDKYLNEGFDYIITVCDNAKDSCPIFPGNHNKLHWDIEDPAEYAGTEEEILNFFRTIRDKIGSNVREFIS